MSAFKPEDERRLDLRNAVSGTDLTPRDERLLDWMAGWDQDTTDALADLIVRARAALQGAGTRRGSVTGVSLKPEVSDIILCTTGDGCTCGAPVSTPAGMHHCDCAVHPGWCGQSSCLPCQEHGHAGAAPTQT